MGGEVGVGTVVWGGPGKEAGTPSGEAVSAAAVPSLGDKHFTGHSHALILEGLCPVWLALFSSTHSVRVTREPVSFLK